MSADTRHDEILRSLDAAHPPTAEQQQRALRALDNIVASAPGASGPAGPVRRSRRRLMLACGAAAAAALAGAVGVLPGDVGGGRAYASWTPVPIPLTDAEVAMIGPECRDGLAGGLLNLKQARLVLAERRGEYAMLLYRTDNPDMAGSCLAHNVPGSDDVEDVRSGVGGGSGPAQTAPPTGYTQGAIADFIDASVTDGAVGTDVTGVTIHARELSVQASVANGRFVAWWPGRAFHDTDQPSGEGGPELFITYDLTLRDGTVLRDAQPTLPR